MDVEKPGCKDSSIEIVDGKHDGDLKLLSLWIELQLYFTIVIFFFFGNEMINFPIVHEFFI